MNHWARTMCGPSVTMQAGIQGNFYDMSEGGVWGWLNGMLLVKRENKRAIETGIIQK